MLCDGVMDCPDSEDELTCHGWINTRGYLSCKDDSIVVHPHYICDGVVHCLLHADDEHLCNFTCPRLCQCKGHTVLCKLLQTVSKGLFNIIIVVENVCL